MTRILVLCTGNSCRSQMAHAWLEKWLHGRAEIRSAGLEPKGVHPLAIEVMAEVGLNIAAHASNHLNEYLNESFDFVITVCDNAAEHCPSFPGNARRLHWPFADPATTSGTEQERLEFFRRVRDQIGAKVRTWIEDFEQ